MCGRHNNDTSQATFLLVDDDSTGLMSMQRALKKLNIANDALAAHDGLQAVQVLTQAAQSAGGVLPPFIVLLDMNMPRMDGREVLENLAKTPMLRTAIVFVCEAAHVYRDRLVPAAHPASGHLDKDDMQLTLAHSISALKDSHSLIRYHQG